MGNFASKTTMAAHIFLFVSLVIGFIIMVLLIKGRNNNNGKIGIYITSTILLLSSLSMLGLSIYNLKMNQGKKGVAIFFIVIASAFIVYSISSIIVAARSKIIEKPKNDNHGDEEDDKNNRKITREDIEKAGRKTLEKLKEINKERRSAGISEYKLEDDAFREYLKDQIEPHEFQPFDEFLKAKKAEYIKKDKERNMGEMDAQINILDSALNK